MTSGNGLTTGTGRFFNFGHAEMNASDTTNPASTNIFRGTR
jgi:hypothetical protein